MYITSNPIITLTEYEELRKAVDSAPAIRKCPERSAPEGDPGSTVLLVGHLQSMTRNASRESAHAAARSADPRPLQDVLLPPSPQRGGHHTGAPAPGRASGMLCTRSSPTRPPGDAGWRSVVARGGGDPSPLPDLWRCRRGVLGRRGSAAQRTVRGGGMDVRI